MALIYKKWHDNIQEGPVDLVELQRDLKKLEDQVAREEVELYEMRATLDKAKEDLQALQGLRNFLVHGQPLPRLRASASPRATAPPSRPGRPRSGKRDAILSILADGQELHASAIRTLLIEAGEMAPDQKSYHSLQVTLSQMYRARELDRTGRGVYKIA